MAATQHSTGEISSLESGILDNDRVYTWLTHLLTRKHLDVQGILYDPYQFGPMLTAIQLLTPQWPMVQVRQDSHTLSMPTKQFREHVIGGRLKTSDNRLMQAAAILAVLMSHNNGVRINKLKYANKITHIHATLHAYALAFKTHLDNYLDEQRVFSEHFGF